MDSYIYFPGEPPCRIFHNRCEKKLRTPKIITLWKESQAGVCSQHDLEKFFPVYILISCRKDKPTLSGGLSVVFHKGWNNSIVLLF